MKAKHVLTMHTATFVAFVLGSISTPYLAMRFPGFFSSWYYLAGVVAIMIGVLASWKMYGGCFFTVWENHYLEKESPGSSYANQCLPYYAYKWFGWKIPNRFFTALLVILLIIPILVGIL